MANLKVQKLPNNTIQIQQLEFMTTLRIKFGIDAGRADEPALIELVNELFRATAPDEINAIDEEIERVERGADKAASELAKLQQQRKKLINLHILQSLRDRLNKPQSDDKDEKIELGGV